MKNLEATTPGWELVEKATHFTGRPPFCTAQLEFLSRSSEKIKIKRLPLSGVDIQAPNGLPLTVVDVSVKLAPGAREMVSTQLAVHPQTPPGSYYGELGYGEQRRPVTIEVLPLWQLHIAPAGLSFKLKAGEIATQTHWFTNKGNMTCILRKATFAPLAENGGIHRALFRALKAVGDEGYEPVLNHFASELQKTEVEPATVKIRGDTTLKPGECKQLTLEYHFPMDLRRNHIYRGSVSFENTHVRFDLEVSGNKETSDGKVNK
jgi:hypothetical protein